jgi:hypothetical protein
MTRLRTGRPGRVGCAVLTALLLAGCGGRGASIDGFGSASALSKHKAATLNIKIAGSSAQSKLFRLQQKRRTKYVSLATNGIAIYAYQASQPQPSSPTEVADVSATSPFCSVDSDGSGDRVCSIPVTAPAGTDDFVIDGYDQPPSNGQVAGNELETGTALDVTIVQGQQNQVNVTFDGIIASIQMSPIWETSQNDGVSHTYPFAVDAADADGYQIIDVAPFANALSVTVQNDPNNTLKVIPPIQGADPRVYSFTYNGKVVNDGQIVASAAGVSATSTLDFTPIVVSPTSLTINMSNPTGTFTAQMAVPSDQTPNPSYQYWSVASQEPQNCSVASPSGLFGNDAYPWSNGNPVTFTVTALAGNGCSIAVTGPETSTGYALNLVQVTIKQ